MRPVAGGPTAAGVRDTTSSARTGPGRTVWAHNTAPTTCGKPGWHSRLVRAWESDLAGEGSASWPSTGRPPRPSKFSHWSGVHGARLGIGGGPQLRKPAWDGQAERNATGAQRLRRQLKFHFDAGDEESVVLPAVNIPGVVSAPEEIMLLRNTFKSLLQMAFIEEISASREDIVTVPSGITVREAITILKKGAVRAAPVYRKCSSTGLTLPVGIIDFIDLNKRLCELVLRHHPNAKNTKELDRVADDFYETVIDDLPGVTTEPLHCLRPGSTLLEAAQSLMERHRVFATDLSGNINQIISQRDLLETIAKLYELKLMDPAVESDAFGNVKFDLGFNRDDCKLTACGLSHKQTVYVEPNHLAIEAFLRMCEAGVSKCIVVDEKGAYVWHISVKDLKHLAPEELLGPLFMPSLEFVQLMRKRCVKEQHPCVIYDRGDTLEKFLLKLCKGDGSRSHRVFVLDGDHRPVSVISLRDILGRMIAEDWFTPEVVKAKDIVAAMQKETSQASLGMPLSNEGSVNSLGVAQKHLMAPGQTEF